MAGEKTSIELKLKNVRLSFFHGFVPQENRNKEGVVERYSYNTSILIPKGDPLEAVIKKAMGDVKRAMWGDSAPRLGPDKLCLRDGEPADEEGVRAPLYDGYEGMLYLSANSPVSIETYEAIKAGKKKRPVSIIGPRKGADGKFKQLGEDDEFAPYSGSYANVIVQIYAYKGDPAKNLPARINASLEAVQFKAHGEAFGRRAVDVDSAFDEEDVEDDDSTSTGASDDDGFDIG
jgi:hypothetical protein